MNSYEYEDHRRLSSTFVSSAKRRGLNDLPVNSKWQKILPHKPTCSPAPGHWGPSPALLSPPFPWRWGSGRGCGAGWEESLGSETGSSAGSTCARHRCNHTHTHTSRTNPHSVAQMPHEEKENGETGNQQENEERQQWDKTNLNLRHSRDRERDSSIFLYNWTLFGITAFGNGSIGHAPSALTDRTCRPECLGGF